jgi:Na+/melibiose symporter-like transporter
MRATWRLLAGHRDLRLVLGAGLVSMSGDWILLIGLLYRVYALTGSTVESALVMLSAAAPQVLLGAVAGVFADRWDRKRTMVVADLLLAAGLLPLLAVRGAGETWIVFGVLLWEGAVQQFFAPAQHAMIPRLVPGDQLLTANALSGQAGSIARLGGSALGGLLAAAGGIMVVTCADVASFLISAAALALVGASGQVRRDDRDAPGSGRLASVATDLADGLRLVAARPLLRGLLAYGLVTSIGEGVFSTLITPFAEHVLHATSTEFGLIAAAQAVGGIAGGVLAAAMSQRVPAARLLGWGCFAFGVMDLAIFLYPLAYPAVWPAVAGMVVVGLPGALAAAGQVTLLQRGTEDAWRGRAFGALGAAEGAAGLGGTLAAGYLSVPLGIIAVICVQGADRVLAGLGVVAWLRPAAARGQGEAGQLAVTGADA